jgi:tRNA uridine 5-carboxymethylaminomethyl modification enzyme
MGISAGCVTEGRKAAFDQKLEHIENGKAILSGVAISASQAAEAGIKIAADGAKRDGMALLAFADVDFDDLLALRPELVEVNADVRQQLKTDALYAQYIERQAKDVESLRRDEAHVIPLDFDYAALTGLSAELQQKLVKARPTTLGQAGRVEGMTPAALTLILAKLRRDSRKRA